MIHEEGLMTNMIKGNETKAIDDDKTIMSIKKKEHQMGQLRTSDAFQKRKLKKNHPKMLTNISMRNYSTHGYRSIIFSNIDQHYCFLINCCDF